MRTKLVLAALVVLAAAGAAPAAFAQGCAACRASVEAAGSQASRAMDIAILVLLLPTIVIFVGILFFTLRYRNYSGPEKTSITKEELFPYPYSPDDRQPFRPSR